jgi:hypothetical protein
MAFMRPARRAAAPGTADADRAKYRRQVYPWVRAVRCRPGPPGYGRAAAGLRQHLWSRCGLAADGRGARTAVEAMLGSPAEERVAGADLAADGDMILFQRGADDRGAGPGFEYGIIRQLITGPGDDTSEGTWQMQLILPFRPDEDIARLPGRGAVGSSSRPGSASPPRGSRRIPRPPAPQPITRYGQCWNETPHETNHRIRTALRV